jgi:uncharacterized delta-60 repeat protein
VVPGLNLIATLNQLLRGRPDLFIERILGQKLKQTKIMNTDHIIPNAHSLTRLRSWSGAAFVAAQLVLSITPVQATPSWTATGSLNTGRAIHSAELLPNGKVLIAGGRTIDGKGGEYLSSAELYNPNTGTWSATGSLNTERANATATLLPNSKVLAVGGKNENGVLNSAELYDSTVGTWVNSSTMSTMRWRHTATLLGNGKVLVTGGSPNVGFLATAELYDPNTGTWTPTGSMNAARAWHTATLLPNGKVLVAGGGNTSSGTSVTSAELYDPASGTWTSTGSLNTARRLHSAILLPDGRVLVSGGSNGTAGYLATAEIYNPATGTWTSTGSLGSARCSDTSVLLPNGTVLVAGGQNSSGNALSSAEIFDPNSGTWTATASLNTGRSVHTATLLPNGKVLVTAGRENLGNGLTSAELYDWFTPVGNWAITGTMNAPRAGHTATSLRNGKVLVAGGENSYQPTIYLTSSESYNPSTGTWSITGSMSEGRTEHTATILTNGRVLVAGGHAGCTLSSAEVYDSSTGNWTPTGSLIAGRYQHTATLLPNGKVLVAGGWDPCVTPTTYSLSSAELYNPATGTWSSTGSMNAHRNRHTATLLPNGKVLVTGGYDGSTGLYLDSAELYDPATGTWSSTGSMSYARWFHSAILLPNNGMVLAAAGVAPGYSEYDYTACELYNPATGTWSVTGDLGVGRTAHTATLLLPSNGKVLIAGGSGGGATAELYDPTTGTWTTTASMNYARTVHTARLLSNGKVLAAGGVGPGRGDGFSQSSAEFYTP